MTATAAGRQRAAVARDRSPATTATSTPASGTVTFQGKGYTHNDVAAWLDSLAKQTGYDQPYFTESTEEQIGDR